MWINPSNKSVFRLHHEIRMGFPETSFPHQLTDEIIESLGLVKVTQTEKPAGHVVEEVEPLLINGTWTQQWVVRAPTEQETSTKEFDVRAERNRLLTASDWTQTLDAPVDREAWATYRQQLRDITIQTGFPWEFQWPEAPQ